MAFIEPCFGIGHNLSLICQMTSEDIKHQLIIINAINAGGGGGGRGGERRGAGRTGLEGGRRCKWGGRRKLERETETERDGG